MKCYECSIVLFIIAACLVVLAGVTSQYWLGPDNAIEQASESVIKYETGTEVDLSPEKK